MYNQLEIEIFTEVDQRVKKVAQPLKEYNSFNPEKPFILTSMNRYGKPLHDKPFIKNNL